MENIIAPNYSIKEKKAWAWFWKMAGDAMADALDVLESGEVGLIRESWDEAKASMPAEELGEVFFKELARIAPHVTHLFKRPKRIQALQFINVIEMLVTFNEEPEQVSAATLSLSSPLFFPPLLLLYYSLHLMFAPSHTCLWVWICPASLV